MLRGIASTGALNVWTITNEGNTFFVENRDYRFKFVRITKFNDIICVGQWYCGIWVNDDIEQMEAGGFSKKFKNARKAAKRELRKRFPSPTHGPPS